MTTSCSPEPQASVTSVAAENNLIFSGPFAATRMLLDYTWHEAFDEERQAMQDIIISQALERAPTLRLPHQWYIHTAGAMGAGKGHVLRYLAQVGAFPSDAFLTIDPDPVKTEIARLRPLEWARFMAEDPMTAHSRLHRESAYIVEVIEREALMRGWSVVHDGSLRDADWYSNVIARVRREHPICRLAILMVTASPETVHRRAERRAHITGRFVPPDVLDASIQQVPLSFARLRRLVDYSCVFDNDEDGSPPKVVPPDTLETVSGIWTAAALPPNPWKAEAGTSQPG